MGSTIFGADLLDGVYRRIPDKWTGDYLHGVDSGLAPLQRFVRWPCFPLWRDAEASSPTFPPGLLPFLTKKYGHPKARRFCRLHRSSRGKSSVHKAFRGRSVNARIVNSYHRRLQDFCQGCGDRADRSVAAYFWRTHDRSCQRAPCTTSAFVGRKSPADSSRGSDITGTVRHARLNRLRSLKKTIDCGQWVYRERRAQHVNYEVSGKQVLLQWSSYRKKDRERPIIGDRRQPSPLGDIQPNHWLAEYTTELINVLNVLGLLVDLEPAQAKLLEEICAGLTISGAELRDAGALEIPPKPEKGKAPTGPDLFAGVGSDQYPQSD